MGQTAPAGPDASDTAIARRSNDKRVLLVFAVLVGLSTIVSVGLYLSVEDFGFYDLLSSTLSGLSFSFLVVGIPFFLRYKDMSLTPRKIILKWMAAISGLITAVFVTFVLIVDVYAPDLVQLDESSVGGLFGAAVVTAVVSFVAFFLVCAVALLTAFGVVGVIVALERKWSAWVLRRIANLNAVKKSSLVGRAIRWLFDIPDILDTKTLSIRPPEPRTRIALSDLRSPVIWQLVFGLVLGIYISFNPFVSDRSPSTLMRLFSLLATGSMLFPFIVLPWFLVKRLGAEISGQTRQFTLYNGIRARVFQSYFALGTIVLIVRLSIQEIAVALDTFLLAFASFMGTLLVSAIVFTFVYCNYFENVLTEDVVEGLRGTEVRIINLGEADRGGSPQPSVAEP